MEAIPIEKEKKEGIFYDFDSLQRYWRDHKQEATEATVDKQIEFARAVANREKAMSAVGIARVLLKYDINPDNIRHDEEGFFHMDSIWPADLPALPEGYGFKGGAARYVLLRTLGVKDAPKPRDFDVVRLAETEPYEGADNEIAEKVMKEDFSHGHGVEKIFDLKNYFSTRDLTINEVVATNQEVVCTGQALSDLARHILRQTPYLKKSLDETDPGILAKMIRLQAESIVQFEKEMQLENIDDWDFEDHFIPPFWIALHLDKAFERGYEFAQTFVEGLLKKNQLPEDVDTPEKAVKYLLDIMEDDSFYFRHAPSAQYSEEDSFAESDGEDLYALQEEMESKR